MFRRKDEKIDISSLNEILSFGRKLIKILYIVMMVGAILLGIYLLKELKILVFLKEMLIVISPVFIGLLIAWLCDPIVKFLQNKKMPRFVGCIIVYLGLLGLIFMILYLFLPTFVSQIGDFVATIPDILADLKVFGNRFFDTFATDGIDVKAIQTQVYTTIEDR